MAKKNNKKRQQNQAFPTLAATATVALAGQLTPTLALATYALVLVLALLSDWLNNR
ncbi:hypothetical protein MCC01989_21100 [Bifidobacteriaceae bacterium MCC01989]|uniref:hypothetical protein n=1 Tax=Bifidobacterium longum TaxID=216816 RepID=UPI0009EFA97A|nr:hypothetical protein [Bifidobacterium longum]OQM60034.1 hypothetical protein B5780_0697 [Bifidobacterium longum]GDZ76847.1 hypothetical protein MCC01989_21100 [Bifidobacteriaceae bacterium MCC01989]